MTQRVIGGSTYNLAYDAENRLTQVTEAATATFVYDGDGKRVKAVLGGTTATYIGNYFEWTGSTATMMKYYYAGGIRIAMRQGSSDPQWILGDHLGSTSVVANFNGSFYSSQGYKAWGETRFGSSPTRYQYTGQYNQTEIGLYYYNARWYDPLLGRFSQPNSIVPEVSQGVQAWDRYAYVNNSPINYSDPTGHDLEQLWFDKYGELPPPPDPPDPPTPTLPGIRFITPITTPTPYGPLYKANPTSIPNPIPDQSSEQAIPIDFCWPWELNRFTGLGLRFAGSGWVPHIPFLGGQGSIDINYNVKEGKLTISVTPTGYFGIGRGLSGSIGTTVLYDAPTNSSIQGPSSGFQITVVPKYGAQVTYTISKKPTDGKYAQLWQIDFSIGGEGSLSLVGGYTFPILSIDANGRIYFFH